MGGPLSYWGDPLSYQGRLVFPHDVMHSIDHILLKVREPKTRFRAARHQSGKVEAPDLIETCWLGLVTLERMRSFGLAHHLL